MTAQGAHGFHHFFCDFSFFFLLRRFGLFQHKNRENPVHRVQSDWLSEFDRLQREIRRAYEAIIAARRGDS